MTVLQILPLVFIGMHESAVFSQWLTYGGSEATEGGRGFELLLFGVAVIFSLIAQNGE